MIGSVPSNAARLSRSNCPSQSKIPGKGAHTLTFSRKHWIATRSMATEQNAATAISVNRRPKMRTVAAPESPFQLLDLARSCGRIRRVQ